MVSFLIFALMILKKRICILLIMMTTPALYSFSVGQNLDYRILKNLQDHRTETGSEVMRWTSNSVVLAPLAPVGMAIGGWAADNKPLLADAATVGASMGTSLALVMGTKYIVRRPRPYIKYEGELVSVTTEPDPSFPSGHTVLAFSTATSLSMLYPRWYVVAPSMLWATAVGFSRLYLGVHYPSDVLVGALVGAGVAVFSYYVAQRLREDTPWTSSNAVVLSYKFSF
jgi:membrane-associated phospholipid phosphatase